MKCPNCNCELGSNTTGICHFCGYRFRKMRRKSEENETHYIAKEVSRELIRNQRKKVEEQDRRFQLLALLMSGILVIQLLVLFAIIVLLMR